MDEYVVVWSGLWCLVVSFNGSQRWAPKPLVLPTHMYHIDLIIDVLQKCGILIFNATAVMCGDVEAFVCES